MKEFKGCKNYKLIAKENLTDSNSVAFTLEHEKTKAKVVLIQNDDDNKAFIIGFRTPQFDSTGVPHILEHCCLCGSEKYPVKDAMTEVSKGSLNTFLNAYTYPDRTLYPVASCNDKDFQNLMSVYLDAVFHPNVLKEEKIFKQEGWRLELEDKDAPLEYNGVVYNEMKGAYSSPESALSSYILFSLFPDTQYGVESGGDPEVIPSLTYEAFCDFYNKLYHPSNSRIYLYGDMDFEEKLEYIDREYLSKFEYEEIDSRVLAQKPFSKPVRIEKYYSVSETETEEDSTFLTYNVVCSDYTEPLANLVMSIINYALCSVPGAKLKQRLIDEGIGKDVYSEFSTDTASKTFSIIAQGANPEDEERFIKIIEATIKEIINEGFDKKTLEAAITCGEFSYREADFGYYPKGIAYGTMVFEAWLYSDDDIFTNLKQNEVYRLAREGIDTGLFEKYLKERILENNHKTIIIFKPKKGLDKEKDEALIKRLSDLKASLSDAELEKIIKDTKEFDKYQNQADSDEARATIPTLSIKDIKKEFNNCIYSIEEVDGIKEIYSDLNTNGIIYYGLNFDITNLPKRLLPALSVLKSFFGMVNTKNYSYADLVNEINIHTGALNVGTNLFKSYIETDEYSLALDVRCKVLPDKIDESFRLVKEILFTSDFNDKKRIKELLETAKVRIEGYMISSGHAVAAGRAGASLSDSAAVYEIISGIGQYRFICDLLNHFDEKFDKLLSDIKEILDFAINKTSFDISLGCERKDKESFDRAASKFIKTLKEDTSVKEKVHICKTFGNEAFFCASQVQYVVLCGNYIKKAGCKYNGSIQVVRNILNTDYLWNEVRQKGGAYGCFCTLSPCGDCSFMSYRDPNLKDTFEAYKKVSDYIESFDGSKEDIERFIISTIGDYDSPMTPSMKATRAYNYYKTGITNEMKQKERDEILSTDKDKIKACAKHLRGILEYSSCSCVGGTEILKEEGTMFDKITPLIG